MENDAIIADYMARLSDGLSGQSYSKAELNRALQQLIGRGRGSIEYKHQNISALLKGRGVPVADVLWAPYFQATRLFAPGPWRLDLDWPDVRAANAGDFVVG